jgi:HK97 family phage portal protein
MANNKILAGFIDFFNTLLGRGNSTASGMIPVGGPAIYPDPNTQNYIDKGYGGNGSVYTIISRYHRKFGSIPRYVYKIKDKNAYRQMKALLKQRNYKLKQLRDLQVKAYDETVVDDNPFAELLNQPNEHQGQDAFYERASAFYKVTGNCFIWKNRGDIKGLTDDAADKMPPLELYVLPTQCIEIIPDPDDVWGAAGYVFNIGGLRFRIRKNDMIHWKTPNLVFDAYTRDHLFGMSPLKPGNKFLTEDDSATDAAVAMQQNDGAKGALYNKQLGRMDPEQKSRVDLMINRKINNRSLKGAVTALEGEWGYLAMGQTGQEMELMDARDKGFVRLCNLLGVPPMLFLTNTTYDNVKQAEKAFITNLVAPDCTSLRDEMNRSLLPDFGLDSSYTHDIDISMLPELQDEMSQMVTQLSAAWWYTPNQKLEMMNEDRSDDPNMDKVWIPNTLVLMEDAALSDANLDSYTNDSTANPNDPGSPISDSSTGGTGTGNKKRLPATA